ncbi:hypothetical protein VTK56DRAFT_862 [Thermocarpiscus australiensis]
MLAWAHYCEGGAQPRNPNSEPDLPLRPGLMASPRAPDCPGPLAPEPPSYGSWSLERLPNELLQPVAEYLVPAPPVTTRFALRPSGTWELRDVGHQWADWLAGHRDLLAFAQTSRRMFAIANPFLYHTLVIPTPGVLVTLYCRQIRRPEIRPWIRSITCLVDVAAVSTARDISTEWQRQTGVNMLVTIFTTLDLLKCILLNSPNLRDFLLACPDHDLAGPDSQSPFQETILRYRTAGYHTSSGIRTFFDFFPFSLMRNLTSLRIYCNREGGNRDLTLSRLLADYAVETLSQLASLRTLELCCASADGIQLSSHTRTFPPLPQLRHLRLYGSHIHEPRLVAFCLACVNLRTLVVHFEDSSTDADRDLLPEGKTLGDALVGLAGSLQTLELVALSEGHYLTRGRERPRKPENHRLRCIPELRRLESLTLDYRGVFGTLGILEEDDGERLCQLLPPSVRDFTLVCEWGTERDWKQSYLANLDMVLHGVECLCDSKARQLSSISLAIHSWPAESRFHKRFKREVEMARQRCARAGIKFRTFDLFPSYRDEDEMEPAEEEEPQEEEEEGTGAGLGPVSAEEELELEEEDEASEYYDLGDEEPDPERQAQRPPTFEAFLQRLGENHGHSLDELFYAYHEDRWDEYLFED